MSGFKQFMLNEAAKAKYTLAFMTYERDDHGIVAGRVKDQLINEWTKIINRYDEVEMNVDPDSKKATLQNTMELDRADAKVGRYSGKISVAPSVRVGNAYSEESKSSCKKKLMQAAKKVLEKQISKLNTGLKGKPFYVSQEDGPLGDIRLKFKTGDIKKTVFLVSIDHSYKFDRVFLRDFLR